MVLVDTYSRYFEMDLLPNTKSVTVIRRLKVHFSRFGSPMTLKTDNAAIFTCEQFQSFLEQWNITHETSSPTYTSSNGLSEDYVKNRQATTAESKGCKQRHLFIAATIQKYATQVWIFASAAADVKMSKIRHTLYTCTT